MGRGQDAVKRPKMHSMTHTTETSVALRWRNPDVMVRRLGSGVRLLGVEAQLC